MMEDSDDKAKGPPEKKPASQGNNLVWYVLGFGVLLLLMSTFLSGHDRLTIDWYDLERLIKVSNPDNAQEDPPLPDSIKVVDASGTPAVEFRFSKLDQIKVGAHEVTGTVDTEKREQGTDKWDEKIPLPFRTYRLPTEEGLQTLLSENNLPHTVTAPPSTLLSYLPVLMLTGMLLLLMFVMLRRMGGAGSPMAFGRSRGKLIAQEDVEVSFDDVAGIDEAVEELREVVEFLKTPERYQRLGGRIPKGVLLVGPPGTGKTLLAKAIAGEAEVPFFSLSGSDFVEMFVGVGAARVRDMFQQAETRAPCIIFIDELDALGKTRGSGQMGGHDEREQTLNALLVEMDGFGTNSGVIVMAATNRPETLDAALLRPGRFDRHVLVDRPDVAGREAILNVHLKNICVGDDVDVKNVAAITSGFVGADLANIVNEAALLAARNGKKAVGMAEFDEAVERSAIGLEKKSRIMLEEEKIRVAYHEGGHALMAYSLPITDQVHKVSIIPRGMGTLGYVLRRPEQDRFMWTREQLDAQIQVALAGTIAEELIYGDDIGNGATSDLERATEVARSMVMDYGMSRLGRVKYRESARNQFLGNEFGSAQLHSEQTAREIDEEVKRIIDEALERVRHVIKERRDALEAIMKELMEHETIDADEFKRIMEENWKGARIVPGTEADRKPAVPAASDDAATDKPSGSAGG